MVANRRHHFLLEGLNAPGIVAHRHWRAKGNFFSAFARDCVQIRFAGGRVAIREHIQFPAAHLRGMLVGLFAQPLVQFFCRQLNHWVAISCLVILMPGTFW